MTNRSAASTPALVLGFLAVYVIWGSTYLAIRWGVESLPPFLMAAVRFMVPGAALYAWARWRGTPAPSGRQWRASAVIGALLLLGGNGLVTWAEQWVPSGLAALFVASVPLWMGLMHWLVEPAARPRARGIAGLLLGFTGVAILVNTQGGLDGDRMLLLGSLAIVAASAFWAAGSLYSRSAEVPADPILATGMQMLTGAGALTIAGTLSGEWSRFEPAAVTSRSLLALAYLIVFGSIIAFSAYVWLLRVAAPAKVATYAYVNPVVAVILGWALAGEALTARTLVAATVIVASVVMITSEKAAPPSARKAAARQTPALNPD